MNGGTTKSRQRPCEAEYAKGEGNTFLGGPHSTNFVLATRNNDLPIPGEAAADDNSFVLEDEDLLEDTLIETQQAIEMAGIYENVLNAMINKAGCLTDFLATYPDRTHCNLACSDLWAFVTFGMRTQSNL